MTLSFAVVCEAPADQRTACDLADRVFVENIEWLDEDLLEYQRQWRGCRTTDRFLLWTRVDDEAKKLRIRAHGHFVGEPGASDAGAARKALLVLYAIEPRPAAVFLIRDDDGDSQRRRGLEQAKRQFTASAKLPVVIGLAHIMRENWVLAGFVPMNIDESNRLAEVISKEQFGFDPTLRPEELHAKKEGAKRNPKRVLSLLTGGDFDRESDCWRATPLAILRERGLRIGLTDYLQSVCDELVAIFRDKSLNS